MEKAYKNMDFLTSRDARVIRMLSEYLEPQGRFTHYNVTDTVVFFGSARTLAPETAKDELARAERSGDKSKIQRATSNAEFSRYYADATSLARMLTEWSKSLELATRRFIVTSGGGPGIMEAANRGASEAAGISVGLGISLPHEGTINQYITRELAFEFHYFFMRKFWFVYLAKAIVIFPGGFGTMDEFFELLTLVQTEKIDRKIPIVLYGEEFWKEVVNFDALVKWGTISEDDLKLFTFHSTPESAFGFLTREMTELYLKGTPQGA